MDTARSTGSEPPERGCPRKETAPRVASPSLPEPAPVAVAESTAQHEAEVVEGDAGLVRIGTGHLDGMAMVAVAESTAQHEAEAEEQKRHADAIEAAIESAAEAAVIEELEKDGVHWVDNHKFNGFITVAIIFNGVMMGLDLDYDLGIAGFLLENLFTAIWTVEMILRISSNGARVFFNSRWNWLDFCLALLSVLDTWCMPLFEQNSQGLRMLSILRVLRMARVVRVIRVLKSFGELWLLVNGLVQAMRVLVWVVLLSFIIVYVGALFTTHVVGKECGHGGIFESMKYCEQWYGSVFRSGFTLFRVITLDMSMTVDVVLEMPWMLLFFLGFVYLTSFGLLNIVMGVIVEQTLENARQGQEKVQKQKEDLQRLELKMLKEIFDSADKDGSGMVSHDEFLGITLRPDVRDMFAILELPVSRKNLATRLFEVLDADGHGEIHINAFLERAFQLKTEGRRLNRDQTLLLMDVRHLGRRLRRVENGLKVACPIENSHCPASAGMPA